MPFNFCCERWGIIETRYLSCKAGLTYSPLQILLMVFKQWSSAFSSILWQEKAGGILFSPKWEWRFAFTQGSIQTKWKLNVPIPGSGLQNLPLDHRVCACTGGLEKISVCCSAESCYQNFVNLKSKAQLDQMMDGELLELCFLISQSMAERVSPPVSPDLCFPAPSLEHSPRCSMAYVRPGKICLHLKLVLPTNSAGSSANWENKPHCSELCQQQWASLNALPSPRRAPYQNLLVLGRKKSLLMASGCNCPASGYKGIEVTGMGLKEKEAFQDLQFQNSI